MKYLILGIIFGAFLAISLLGCFPAKAAGPNKKVDAHYIKCASKFTRSTNHPKIDAKGLKACKKQWRF